MNYDTIVIGTGGIGGAALWQLAKAGQKVLGLDRFQPPHTHGSSHGSTRIIRKAYFEDARYIPLMHRSYELWEELEEGRTLFHRCGLLIMSPESGSIAQSVHENASQAGIPIEILDHASVRSRYGQFAIPEGFYGVLEPNAGYLEVENCVSAFIKKAQGLGAILITGETVLDVEGSNTGVVVKTDRNTYQAAKAVVSAGTGSRSLFPEGALTVTRAMQFWFEGTDKHSESAGMPCFAFALGQDFIYGFPNIASLGVKIANYAPGDSVKDPLEELKQCSDYQPKELRPLEEIIEKYLPGISPQPKSHQLCFYTLTPDENFILGPHPENKNTILATGGSGHAFKFAPVLGEITAAYVLAQEPRLDVSFLKPRTGSTEEN